MRERLARLPQYWTDPTDEGRMLRRLNILFYAWALGAPVPVILLGAWIYPPHLIGAALGGLLGVLAALLLASPIFRRFEQPLSAAQVLAQLDHEDDDAH